VAVAIKIIVFWIVGHLVQKQPYMSEEDELITFFDGSSLADFSTLKMEKKCFIKILSYFF
jgi:hypothetical protein